MKKLFCIISAVVISFSLCSCAFKDGTQPKDETAQTEAAEEKNVTNDITAGITGFDSYNPLRTTSPSVRDVCGFIFEPLFGLDGNMKPEGILALSCTAAPDGGSVTVRLKRDVKWHDGSAFTARDVVYTINQLRMGGTNYDRLAEPISGVTPIADDAVVITFSRAVPDAAALLIFPIMKNGSESSASAVGTGPFYVDGDKLTAYEQYHGGRAKLDEIKIRQIPDKEKYISLFNASAIDYATSELLDMTSYMPKSNSVVKDYVSNSMVFVGFNGNRAVFSDKSARRAVSMLIDRDSIATHIYYSRARASEYALNPSSWMGLETRSKLRIDENGALKTLSENGWKINGNGKYYRLANNGTVYFDVNIIVNSDNAERVRVANEICEKMNTVGLQAQVTECTAAQFDYRVSAGDYDMFIGETELLPNNDVSFLVASGLNKFGYSNEEVDIILAQLSAAQNDEELKSLSEQLYKKLAEDVPFATICFMKKSLVVSAKLKDGVSPSIEGSVRKSENWSVK